jgi:hypothetical protein
MFGDMRSSFHKIVKSISAEIILHNKLSLGPNGLTTNAEIAPDLGHAEHQYISYIDAVI